MRNLTLKQVEDLGSLVRSLPDDRATSIPRAARPEDGQAGAGLPVGVLDREPRDLPSGAHRPGYSRRQRAGELHPAAKVHDRRRLSSGRRGVHHEVRSGRRGAQDSHGASGGQRRRSPRRAHGSGERMRGQVQNGSVGKRIPNDAAASTLSHIYRCRWTRRNPCRQPSSSMRPPRLTRACATSSSRSWPPIYRVTS